jgi:hypothetical protein
LSCTFASGTLRQCMVVGTKTHKDTDNFLYGMMHWLNTQT